MAREDNSQKCSNSSSDGGGSAVGNNSGGAIGSSSKSFKRLKQKKVPKRGLGVAQLEKIRLEEQHKKDGTLQPATILPSSPIVPPSKSSSSCLSIPGPSFSPNISSPSIPLLPPPSLLPNSLFRSSPSIPDVDLPLPNSVSFAKPLNLVGDWVNWPAISGAAQGNRPKSRNVEPNNPQGDNLKLDQLDINLAPDMHLFYESNLPIWPLSSVMQRAQQFQLPVNSPMPNVSSGTSSSVTNFAIEPPSNQNYFVNNYTPMLLEEEKMFGMKRSCPFSLETPSAPQFQGMILPPPYPASVSKPIETASYFHGQADNAKAAHSSMREVSSSPSGTLEPNYKVNIKENGGLNGDFLTLAPPSPHPHSKHKIAPSLGPCNLDYSGMEDLPYQVSLEHSVQQARPGGRPFFSFLPSANGQIDRDVGASDSCKRDGEIGDGADLNLKL